MEKIDFIIPGAFVTWWTGTGVAQGQWEAYSDDPVERSYASELYNAWQNHTSRRRGRGYEYHIKISPGCAGVLAVYADMCIEVNLYGDREQSELDAARRVMERSLKIMREHGMGDKINDSNLYVR